MTELLRIVLPIYFVVYFVVAFVLKSVIVAKRIGKNPLILPKDDSAYGIIGLYFKLIFIAMFIYVIVYDLISKARIEIIRILHERMDLKNRLSE